MKILGIDPGLERVGYAVVEKNGSRLASLGHGLILTERVSLPERLAKIHAAVVALLDEHRPDVMATERLLFAQNKTTAMDVSKALGVILLASSERGIQWAEYSPPEIKLAVVGNGAADKKQVQFMVQRILALPGPPKPDDVADALAVAITQAFRGAVPK